MIGVVVAFATIGLSILAGYIATRLKLVNQEQGKLLNRLTFYVFSPALLFAVLAKTSVETIFSPVLLVLLLSAVSIALIFVIASRLFFKRTLAETTIGATASIYVNSNNIGLPVSLFVLGDMTYFAPVVVLQLVLFTPLVLGLLEVAKRKHTSVWRALLQAMLNPLIVASLLGIAFPLLNVPIPDVLFEPVSMMGGAAVPLLLFAYGVSLRGQRIFHSDGDRVFSITSIALKTVWMPVLAYLISEFVFHLSPHEVFAAVILAALPTAQNMFTYASVYNAKIFAIRDVVFTTTLASLPVMFIITALLKA